MKAPGSRGTVVPGRRCCGCWLAGGARDDAAQAPARADPYRAVAEQYVKLVLAVGQHDGDYVDAFYGPPEWRKEAEAAKKPLPDDRRAGGGGRSRAGRVAGDAAGRADAELWALRRQYLTRQLAALRSRVAMLQGKTFTFDEESLRALRRGGADASRSRSSRRSSSSSKRKLPGEGSLIERYDRFKQDFVIPTRPARSGVPGGDSRLPRAHADPRRPAAGRALHRRVRHRQVVERLQLVSGRTTRA